jgi:Copper type II ascorbate-dependent monooxygenase, C-terminal domain/Tetratricopeptide repeat
VYGPAAHSPDGFFIGWTPGKMPFQAQKDMAWDLNPGTDIVLQLHLVPGGKPEPVQASIGLFFADKPPTKNPMVLRVGPRNIDISPGDSDYRIKDQFVLPVDVDVLSVYPHAHYLGRQMLGDIVSPNGVRQPLLRIDQWDFKWQDEYRFATPIPVEKGAMLRMEYSYDNSHENVRNPSQPPRRVTYGPQSSDEMGDLWVQVLPRSQRDREILKAARAKNEFETELKGSIFEVKIRPKDIKARYNLACLLETIGELDAAATQYSLALQISPEHAPSTNNLGVVRCKQGRFGDAIPLLEKALRLDPKLEDARHNLNLAREAIKQAPKP